MPIRRWDPFMDLISLQQELFGEGSEMGLAESGQAGWSPAVDIYETPESFVIKAEVPGIDPETIRVEYKNHRLVLSGQRPGLGRDPARKHHRVERVYGPFERHFALPDCIECEEIEAHYQDGLIEIVVPKRPEYRPRCIKVEGGF